ncbi:MAG TPA: hypothetical protein VK833_02160, partial [Gillisia sp.]|nr:hypothetical protein [Gillisia sp.]
MQITTSTLDFRRTIPFLFINISLFFVDFASGFAQEKSYKQEKEISQTFYITANTGLDTEKKISQNVLNAITQSSQKD